MERFTYYVDQYGCVVEMIPSLDGFILVHPDRIEPHRTFVRNPLDQLPATAGTYDSGFVDGVGLLV